MLSKKGVKMNKDSVRSAINESIVTVLKEYGVAGVITYLGGIVVIGGFLVEDGQKRQQLFGIVGIILLSLSTIIACIRLKVQRDRESSLIDMTKSIGNRMAEQLGVGLSKKEVDGIIQKIRQIQRDLVDRILGQKIE